MYTQAGYRLLEFSGEKMLPPTMMLRVIRAIPRGQSGEILGLDSSCCGSSTSLPPSCPHQKDTEKDDDIEEGDLPEHKRPPAPIDFSKIDPGKPESILKLTKKGKTLMMFVTVSGNPTEKETEEITSLWQGSLFNANYDVQRFIVGSNRAIFMLRDGGYAWEIKDFLINQERCADVTLEGQVYPGKGAEESEKVKNKTKPEKAKKKKDADKKPNSIKEDNRATKQREDL
ncbi:PREDICTED: LDLR chaperone MESD [Charadrius vociferus]|uniref:LDLR chaperone MESD n=1 Tax=Charadrius vociferus TaxID=50402 RepID=UPI0005215A8C|nr:PREDICTED: LDLR chaperone MESD [Charadrius vociferus]